MGRVSLCVGTGRCGTTWLATVAGREPRVAASHERLRLAANFHMYCQWNEIAVDPEGFLVDRELAVAEDLVEHEVSFESNALLSHSLEVLVERLDARVALLVRRPDHTVASFAVRGWFETLPPRGNPDLPPSYRQGEEPRHFFGRITPRGARAYDEWARRTPLGRVAWFWAARNRAILEQFRRLPPTHRTLVRLEDLDVSTYRSLAAFLGWTPTIDASEFDALAQARINTGPHRPRRMDRWTGDEVRDFEEEVAPVAQALGYEHRIAELQAGRSACLSPPPTVAQALDALSPW